VRLVHGGKTKCYIVTFDQLQGHSRGLVRAPELRVRGPLTGSLQLVQDYCALNSMTITNGHLLFVMGALILQRAQKCEVRQVTRDVVKSEV